MKEKQTKERVKKTFIKWLDQLNMSGYRVVVYLPNDKGYQKPSNDSFQVRLDYPYKNIRLYVGQGVLDDYRNGDQILLHEACHIILWSYTYKAESRYVGKEELEDEEELITDHIANLLYPLLTGNDIHPFN